jgi:hypothetical protein
LGYLEAEENDMTTGFSAALAMDGFDELEFAENRENRRTDLNLNAWLRLPDGTTLETKTTDISHTVAGFISPRAVAEGMDCRLYVDLSACGTLMELHLAGRIAFCRDDAAGKYTIGLKFADLETEAADLLDAVLS